MTTMRTEHQPARTRTPSRPTVYALPPSGLLTITAWRHAIVTPSCDLATCTYLERFWLGILGPTATWLTRYLSRVITDANRRPDPPVARSIDWHELSARLGVSAHPLHDSVLSRAVNRLIMFNFATTLDHAGEPCLAVRRTAPRIPERLLDRLHPVLLEEHIQLSFQRFTGEPGCSCPLPH